MTEAEMKAAAQQLASIEVARRNLDSEREKLALFEKCRKAGKWPDSYEWKPSLTLRQSERYGPGGLTITVRLPWQIVQQQLVYAVAAAERDLVKLGGSL